MRPCKSPGCSNPAFEYTVKKTGKVKKWAYCSHCRTEREKAKDLAAWSWRKHRSNAKRRGILFTISLEYFRAWCAETEVLLNAGRSATSLHVDRIVDELGYVEGNLQVLTNSQNVAKENRRRKAVRYVDPQHERDTGGLKTVDITLQPTPDVPF
jgi:hypothetical protein